eukprot:tig00000113_g5580.t1
MARASSAPLLAALVLISAVLHASAVTHHGVLFEGPVSRGLVLASMSSDSSGAFLSVAVVSEECDKLIGHAVNVTLPPPPPPAAPAENATVPEEHLEREAPAALWTGIVQGSSEDGNAACFFKPALSAEGAAAAGSGNNLTMVFELRGFRAVLGGAGRVHRVAYLSNRYASPAPAFPFRPRKSGSPIRIPPGTFGVAVLSLDAADAADGLLTVYQTAGDFSGVRLAYVNATVAADGTVRNDTSSFVVDPACDPAAPAPECIPAPAVSIGRVRNGTCDCGMGGPRDGGMRPPFNATASEPRPARMGEGEAPRMDEGEGPRGPAPNASEPFMMPPPRNWSRPEGQPLREREPQFSPDEEGDICACPMTMQEEAGTQQGQPRAGQEGPVQTQQSVSGQQMPPQQGATGQQQQGTTGQRMPPQQGATGQQQTGTSGQQMPPQQGSTTQQQTGTSGQRMPPQQGSTTQQQGATGQQMPPQQGSTTQQQTGTSGQRMPPQQGSTTQQQTGTSGQQMPPQQGSTGEQMGATSQQQPQQPQQQQQRAQGTPKPLFQMIYSLPWKIPRPPHMRLGGLRGPRGNSTRPPMNETRPPMEHGPVNETRPPMDGARPPMNGTEPRPPRRQPREMPLIPGPVRFVRISLTNARLSKDPATPASLLTGLPSAVALTTADGTPALPLGVFVATPQFPLPGSETGGLFPASTDDYYTFPAVGPFIRSAPGDFSALNIQLSLASAAASSGALRRTCEAMASTKTTSASAPAGCVTNGCSLLQCFISFMGGDDLGTSCASVSNAACAAPAAGRRLLADAASISASLTATSGQSPAQLAAGLAGAVSGTSGRSFAEGAAAVLAGASLPADAADPATFGGAVTGLSAPGANIPVVTADGSSTTALSASSPVAASTGTAAAATDAAAAGSGSAGSTQATSATGSGNGQAGASSSSSSSSQSGLSQNAIVAIGAAVGGTALVAAVAGTAVAVQRRRRAGFSPARNVPGLETVAAPRGGPVDVEAPELPPLPVAWVDAGAKAPAPAPPAEPEQAAAAPEGPEGLVVVTEAPLQLPGARTPLPRSALGSRAASVSGSRPGSLEIRL